MNKVISSKFVALTFGILVVCFAVAFYVIAWQEPIQPPPEGNVPPPINVGTEPQAKAGRLSVTELYDFNDPSYFLNPSGHSNLGTIDSPSIKQYRMVECSSWCYSWPHLPQPCTAECTATCPPGYTIVSSAIGRGQYFNRHPPIFPPAQAVVNVKTLASFRATFSTPGPCTGSSCTGSQTAPSRAYAAVKVKILCESE